MKHPIRHIARIKVEAATPLAIGSGLWGLENERLVARDANGLPFLPGTSLAGVIRHEVKKQENGIDEGLLQSLFGFQEWDEEKKEGRGQGSRLIFSSGMLVDKDDKTVLEGIQSLPDDPFYAVFNNMPERDHVRINDRGVAEEYAKFREQLVPRGARFVFEIEFLDDGSEKEYFEELITVIRHPAFRIGAGTRNGFGALKVVSIKNSSLNLNEKEDLEVYLNKVNSLDENFPGEEKELEGIPDLGENWIQYELTIQPESYFLFGSEDMEYEEIFKEKKEDQPGPPEIEQIDWLDQSSKRESFIDWSSGKAAIKDEQQKAFVLPGTSIKGALSHRVAFHYNQLARENKKNGHTIESAGIISIDQQDLEFDLESALEEFQLNVPIEDMNYPPDSPEWERWEKIIDKMSIDDSSLWEAYADKMEDYINGGEAHHITPVGENNPAVRALFGFAKNSEKGEGQRGKVMIPDITIAPEKVTEKLFNHVAIDRFTGGAIDGALFEERVLQFTEPQTFCILVEKSAFENNRIRQAFKNALDDLVEGRLALGGNTTKGHGIFKGSYHPKIETHDNKDQ